MAELEPNPDCLAPNAVAFVLFFHDTVVKGEAISNTGMHVVLGAVGGECQPACLSPSQVSQQRTWFSCLSHLDSCPRAATPSFCHSGSSTPEIEIQDPNVMALIGKSTLNGFGQRFPL